MSAITDLATIIRLFRPASGAAYSEQGTPLGEVAFSPYAVQGREGVSVHVLYGALGASANGQSVAALVRYEPGARTPRHLHPGSELILVITGELIDDGRRFTAGSLTVHEPGSHHELGSEAGCTLLVVWEKPVVPHSG